MSDVLSSVRVGYDRWANVYDHDANPLQALEEPFMRRAIGDPRGLKTLDLGCGAGTITRMLAAHSDRITAVDFSPKAIALAKTNSAGFEHIEYIQGDIRNVAFSDYDLIVCSEVLYYLFQEELRKLIGKLYTSCGTGTEIIIVGKYRDHSISGILESYCTETGRIEKPHTRRPYAIIAYRF